MSVRSTTMSSKPARSRAPTSHFTPEWEQRNRQDHYDTHGAEVAQVLGRNPSQFDKWDFDAASKDTVTKARLYFDAEHREHGEFRESRAYFVDRHLLQAVTDVRVQRFITYFPESFDGQIPPSHLPALTDGDKLLKFTTSLRNRERSEIYRNVRKHHGFY